MQEGWVNIQLFGCCEVTFSVYAFGETWSCAIWYRAPEWLL